MKKKISILGSTGSIGINTFKIIDKKRSLFKIQLLSANNNYKKICEQIKKYNPDIFVINNLNVFNKIKKKFKNKKVKILNNFYQLSLKKNDITVSAIPGLAGLEPTLSLMKFSKKLLIANKESIICGWELIKRKSKKFKTKIIPVDSEHYSILKLIDNHKLKEIDKIYITASGGPFLNFKANQLKKISPREALNHPKWKMGKKISIDSSTLMNKIFELIEAQKLFNLPKDKLEIIIHPECLVHAIIKFKNGLTKLIYHSTSMVIPLANAIFDGVLNIDNFERKNKNLDLRNLSFFKVNKKIFPTIEFKNLANKYSSSPIIVNACNEVLVDQFLQKKIPFLGIFGIIKTILNNRNYKKYAIRNAININQIFKIDKWAREETFKELKKLL